MKYLGIDYGEKRVGIAISDEEGKLAFPFSVSENSEKLISQIVNICTENNISEIIVGESKDFMQNENTIMEEIKKFAEDLGKEIKLPIRLHPEFMTSVEAERIQGKNEMLDASAAALILRHYLDTINNKNSENV